MLDENVCSLDNALRAWRVGEGRGKRKELNFEEVEEGLVFYPVKVVWLQLLTVNFMCE